MVCNFCDHCTSDNYVDHEIEIQAKCPDFSKDDYMCSVCYDLVFQPMITDSVYFRVVCKECVPSTVTDSPVSPKISFPNYPLRNQLNVFLLKCGLKIDLDNNYSLTKFSPIFFDFTMNNDIFSDDELLNFENQLENYFDME